MCFLDAVFPGAGLALEELGSCSTFLVALLVGFGASESELWRVLLLLSEDLDGTGGLLSFWLLGILSFEESSPEDEDESEEESLESPESLESLELESDGGNGVLLAALSTFLSAFLLEPFPDEEEELEEELSLSLSDEEESEEPDEVSLALESEDSFAFLV